MPSKHFVPEEANYNDMGVGKSLCLLWRVWMKEDCVEVSRLVKCLMQVKLKVRLTTPTHISIPDNKMAKNWCFYLCRFSILDSRRMEILTHSPTLFIHISHCKQFGSSILVI